MITATWFLWHKISSELLSMIRFCFTLLRQSGNITAARNLHPGAGPPLPIGPLGRRAPPPPERSKTSRPTPFYLRSSFWVTTLTVLALLSALIFFLVQWLYQDWTARKDFLEHCQSLQDANKPLTSSCDRALTTPLPPPPFSHGYRVRRYISDSTPLRILLFYEKRSALQQILLIWLCFTAFLILYTLAIHYIGTKFQWIHQYILKKLFGRPYWDEEGLLENYESLQSPRIHFTTAFEAPDLSGLRHRGTNSNDTDIASVLAPPADLIRPSLWTKRKSPRGRRKHNRASTDVNQSSSASLYTAVEDGKDLASWGTSIISKNTFKRNNPFTYNDEKAARGPNTKETQQDTISEDLASKSQPQYPPPKFRKKPNLLSLQTSASPSNALSQMTIDAPPIPGLSSPYLKRISLHLLFSSDPPSAARSASGTQILPFQQSTTSRLSWPTLNDPIEIGAGGIIKEEDLPIRTQMVTRFGADIRDDPFDTPLSQDSVEWGYPDGPIAIYEPNVYLYLEPTREEASKFNVVLNVANEVENPFKNTQSTKNTKILARVRTTFYSMEIDRENIPVADTAASKSTFEWQANSRESLVESSLATPKPFAHSELEYIHVLWEQNTDISKELIGLCEIIDNRVREGKRVLVHSKQGASRSASLVIAYGVYRDSSLSVIDVYRATQAKSKWISPNMKLLYALQDFQKEVGKKKLLPTSGFKRGTGRSPTKQRITLSADVVDLLPNEPLTAPLPSRDGNPPAGTLSRQRSISAPNFGEVSLRPSSAP